ncbi:MAG: U32 family peptidase [Dysgonamonadaceae bacterium]|jgi:putative protease|nr:U32 family peptidase [Dysgonamonadaceae bacterium]
MKLGRKIELLAPAKNLECGIEAIKHGADAVYIGAPQFSARAAAGNSIEDIKTLCDFAHQYFAKVYVALNTILFDSELSTVETLIHQLYNAGADALIIQDMGILQMNLPPIPIHSSTQNDNRDAEKVKFLEDTGFSQVVLARELSLSQIKEIAEQTSVPLEVFIHGALCMSYSGQCYLSQALSGRSANRGACAQYCRLPYTLQDAEGKTLTSGKHLLSLKDLNQTRNLEALLDAGVSSLKIEGRLKELSYVKNITAHYRQKLDEIFARRPEYQKASSGKPTHFFVPNPEKSFNRGFTDYFIFGKRQDIASFNTPKSLGEMVGTVKDLHNNFFTFSGKHQIHNGDGLCFLNEKGDLQGFRVNRVEENKIFPAEMPRLKIGITLHRNYDHEFEKMLSKPSAERKISVDFRFEETANGFNLTATDEDGCSVTCSEPCKKEIANKNQSENISKQLSKLGNTIFELADLQINLSENWFIPSSYLSELRRKTIETLIFSRAEARPVKHSKIQPTTHAFPYNHLTYLGNVSNHYAREFYQQHGVSQMDSAFELSPSSNVPLMFTKHCIRYSLGHCPKLQKAENNIREPLYLFSNQNHLKLEFNCKDCEMKIISVIH